MISLYFGKNHARAQNKINAITQKHITKFGVDSVAFLRCDTKGTAQTEFLVNELSSKSLFAPKKIIVLDQYIKKGTKEIISFLEKIAEKKTSHNVILIEEEIDQRKKLFKLIKKNGEIIQCAPYSPQELSRLALKKFAEQSIAIDAHTIERLVFASGGDVSLLKNNIQKLCSYALDTKKISSKDLDTLVQFPLEENIFQFTEHIARKNVGHALSFFKHTIETQKNAPYLVFMIARQFRNMLLVKYADSHHLSDQEIIKKTHMHPYALSKTRQSNNTFSLQQLKHIIRLILVLDADIKSKGDSQKSFEEFLIKIL